MTSNICACLTRSFLVLVPLCHAAATPMGIRFDKPPSAGSAPADVVFFGASDAFPHEDWESHAQPVGNGRIGAMVFGGTWNERIQFNENSLWTGGANEAGEYTLDDFGAYQNFGNLYLSIDGENSSARVAKYGRSLDLATAIHTTTWTQNGVKYTRDVYASAPHEVIVVRLTSDPPTSMSGKLTLVCGHKGATSHRDDGGVAFATSLPNGLRKAAAARVTADGGTTQAAGDHLAWNGTGLTITLGAATDYKMDPASGFRSGQNPANTVERQVSSASRRPESAVRSAHLEQFGSLMGRVSLEVGRPSDRDITARLEAYRKGASDPNLEALMFHYGRYLLITSSRGSLPANLQGLWNDRNNPPWHADYHTNINVQMNYWGAEVANLAECVKPLLDWTLAMAPGSRDATRRAFGDNTPGWTMRTSVNIFGGNGWQWNLPASAWLALHFHEHHAFSGDREFLRDTAWPLFREVSEFWMDHLVERDGMLVAPNGWSPEHGPREDGVAHDQQIVWDLFTNTLEAANILEIDDSFTRRVAAARERLLGPQIGSWGQLMEWTTEREDLERSGHRHTSHLFAVYPGRQITLHGTPDFAKAAAVSLEARGTSGDSRRSWTWPWRTALWARLGEAERAGEMIRGLLVHNTHPNLLTTHPPFQLDGNLGITGGIAEMLLQSHDGEISILPALPPGWRDGSFTGLRARGGATVDATWKAGKLDKFTIRPAYDGPLRVRVAEGPVRLLVGSSNAVELALISAKGGLESAKSGSAKGGIGISAKAGEVYEFEVQPPGRVPVPPFFHFDTPGPISSP